jgi:hypothetical protein
VAYWNSDKIQAMIRATGGVTIQLGGVSTLGHVDQINQAIQIGEAHSASTKALQLDVTVETGVLVALANDVAIIVDGAAWRVGGFKQIDDGALTVIRCRQ